MQFKGKLLCGVLCLVVSLQGTSVLAQNDVPSVMEAIMNFRQEMLEVVNHSAQYLKLQVEQHKQQIENVTNRKFDQQEARISAFIKELRALQQSNQELHTVQVREINSFMDTVTNRKFDEQKNRISANIQELQKELQESNEKVLAKAIQDHTKQLEETKLYTERMLKQQEKNVVDRIQELKAEVTQLRYNFESNNGHGGGWTVFQRRMDGSVDFYRNWTMYKHGFGDVTGEHWLGLEKLHELTRSGRHQLLVVLEAFDGASAHALYDEFKIGNEAENYKLTVGKYSGTAGDALEYHNGMKFSTFDEDNDLDGTPPSCAEYYKGAWWFNKCSTSHLNGKYRPKGSHLVEGVTWNSFKGKYTSLKASKMMLRSRA